MKNFHIKNTGNCQISEIQPSQKARQTIISCIIALAIGLACIFIIFQAAHPIRINGPSMEPTYHSGDIVFSSLVHEDTKIRRGDVVVFNAKELGKGYYGLFIKRIVAVPGDTVQISDGILYINGKKEDRDLDFIKDPGLIEYPLILKDNEYFVMGDNRNNSNDSRMFGAIDRSIIRNLIKQ